MKLGVWKNWKIISWLRSITHADGNYAAEYSEVSKARGVEYLGLRISNCEYSYVTWVQLYHQRKLICEGTQGLEWSFVHDTHHRRSIHLQHLKQILGRLEYSPMAAIGVYKVLCAAYFTPLRGIFVHHLLFSRRISDVRCVLSPAMVGMRMS
jgi:hypothetical protein